MTLSRTLEDYVESVASSAPAPGGGSVVAVVAALAAALAEMVCNLTVGRPASIDAEPELRDARTRATVLRHRLMALAADDEAAYGRYVAAVSLPKSTDTEKSARHAAMQDALATAADVPLAVANACLDLLQILGVVARLGNKHVLSDAAVGAHLAKAALHGALLNVRVNAKLMSDRERAAWYDGRANEAEGQVSALAQQVLAVTSSRGG